MKRHVSLILLVLGLCVVVLGQTKSFIPVDGANLKARIDGAITAGKANANRWQVLGRIPV